MPKLEVKDLLLVKIFQYLPPQSVLASCQRVNSQWYRASTNNEIWHWHCSDLLMEEEFEWSDKLIFSDKINRDEYWYTIFRTLFWFPMFKRYVIWYQEEDQDEYYNRKSIKSSCLPPPKKRKKSSDDDEDYSSSSEEEEFVLEFSLETINEFRIPEQFRPEVEVGFRKDGDEFDFEMKYSLSKMATVLMILGSEQYSPDLWHDRVVVSIVDSREKILVSAEMTVAALCICIRFDNFEDFYDIVFDSEKSATSKIAISSIYHRESPTCFLENLDLVALAKNGIFEWISAPGKNSFLPKESWDTLHGEFCEIKYRATFKDTEEDNVISIEKHSLHREFI